MNEETLKALTQLLALVSLQDGVITETERNYVINLFRQELDPSTLNEYLEAFDELSGYSTQKKKTDTPRKLGPISLNDTVKTMAICNKLNKILEVKQKAFLLLRVLQLIAVDGHFSLHKKRIIETISAVFNFDEKELAHIEEFVFYRPGKKLVHEEILIINDDEPVGYPVKHVHADIRGELIFLKTKGNDPFFVKYYGEEEILLNGFIMNPGMIYMFSRGSTLKTQLGRAIYYSDLVRKYLKEFSAERISINADSLYFSYPESETGLEDVSVSEEEGKLIGILGSSGSGKTTLINILAGILKPTKGSVRINGVDVHSPEFRKKMKGMIGYVSQDDMLIEELTVYQNLYFNARLCFSDLSHERIHEKVEDMLKILGLWERKDLDVGNVLSKKISGGQRKRLNIALELIREPSLLFVDEPTSGLSSRDSENIMDLLKELTYRGKLVFAVIHQPSSDIFKLFDSIIVLDDGGYMIYYGNPVEAVTYFKSTSRQLDRGRGICPVCGNVNPEQIFNIVEEKLVDEYGNFTDKRKVSPVQWAELFRKKFSLPKIKDKHVDPAHVLHIPSGIRQLGLFIQRDFLSKVHDRQYLSVNLLVAPVLTFILAGIVRYRNAMDDTVYFFRLNDNIPVYFVMGIIMALFLGLMVSAEEIIRDRKIQQREMFLNLSRNSYLLSKLTILFGLSAIQTFLIVFTGNLILEIRDMFLPFWFILFSVACFGNLLGLNLSDAFRSTVTVYILIPLLIIPQMVLSGLFVSFDKIHESIGNRAKVPLIADLMATRWAFEAMAVYQFMNNEYGSTMYPIERKIAEADFRATFYADKLTDLVREAITLSEEGSGRSDAGNMTRLQTIVDILRNEFSRAEPVKLPAAQLISIPPDDFYRFIETIRQYNRKIANEANHVRDQLISNLEASPGSPDIDMLKNYNHNEKLADLVRKTGSKDHVIEYHGRLVQVTQPVYQQNPQAGSFFDYRTPLFVPVKPFMGLTIPTPAFNMTVIWIFTMLLYIFLYFHIFSRILNRLKSRKTKH